MSDSGTLNGATHFYYDGANAIEETDASGKVRRQFIYSHRSDELYAMDVDTNADGATDTLYYYLRDRNNNTTQLYDRQGNAKELYGYSFDGAPSFVNAATMLEVPSSASGNPYLFQGQRYDAETGHYYFKARYYDPKVGVYISRDPLGQWGDSNNFGNGEVLVNHDPWNKRDPSGLWLLFFGSPDATTGEIRVACAWAGDGNECQGRTGGTVCQDRGGIGASCTFSCGAGGKVSGSVQCTTGCNTKNNGCNETHQ